MSTEAPKKKLVRRSAEFAESVESPEKPKRVHLVRRVVETPVTPVAKAIIQPATPASKIGERPSSTLKPKFEPIRIEGGTVFGGSVKPRKRAVKPEIPEYVVSHDLKSIKFPIKYKGEAKTYPEYQKLETISKEEQEHIQNKYNPIVIAHKGRPKSGKGSMPTTQEDAVNLLERHLTKSLNEIFPTKTLRVVAHNNAGGFLSDLLVLLIANKRTPLTTSYFNVILPYIKY